MLEQPLISVPITDMFMDPIDPQYVTRVLLYLRDELHCRVEPFKDRPGYYIHFPIGTVEETYAGQSTQWTRRTTIRFPDNRTLTKYVSMNVRDMRTSQTVLAFPNAILDGPEPPKETDAG